MPLIRIRRMGGHFLTCGMNIGTPPGVDHVSVSGRCPQIVPGQLVEVPDDHWTLDSPLLEIVRRPQADEFVRPWVFDSAESAVKANPSTSNLTVDQIREMLDMVDGAGQGGRERAARATQTPMADAQSYDDDGYVPNPGNRVSRAEADELRGDDEQPAPRRGRASRAERAVR
jgi:hypothetical protein